MLTRLNFTIVILMLLCLVLVSGCSTQTAIPTPLPPTSTVPPKTATPLPPTATASPIPPTDTPIPTDTATPKPSPTPLSYPEAQGYHAMAYDAESNQVILVNNQGNNIRSLKPRTWSFDLETNTWQMRTDCPVYGEGPMAYDAQSDRIIRYIGFLGSGYNLTPTGQTLAYDANTDTWTNMNPVDGPHSLLGARMAYDSESDRMILVGGWDMKQSGGQSTTWVYDYESNAWTDMQPSGTLPPLGNYFAISYDIAADRVLVFIDKLSATREYKIYAYDYNANTWEERDMEIHPSTLMYNSMVYDPTTGLNILFGGIDIYEQVYNEIWGYDYATNSWKRLPGKNPPSARGWQAMVYHDQAGMLVMFGGGASREEFTDETWVYDPVNGMWSEYTVKP